MTIYYGNTISGTWSVYMDISFYGTASNTQSRADVKYGIYFNKAHDHERKYDSGTLYATENTSTKYDSPSGHADKGKGYFYQFGTRSFYFNRPASSSNRTITISYSNKHGGQGASWKGTSSKSISFTVPKRTSYAITYNANKPSGAEGEITNIPDSQTKYYGVNINLSSAAPQLQDWTFVDWIDQNNNPRLPSSVYSTDASLTLNAEWSDDHPPSILHNESAEYGVAKSKDGNAIKGISTISLSFSGASAYTGRTISSVVLNYVDENSNTMTDSLSLADLTLDDDDTYSGTFSISAYNVASSGLYMGTVTITDSDGYSASYEVGTVNVINPTWTKDITFTTEPPSVDSSGSPMLTKLEIWNYHDSAYDEVTTTAQVTITDSGWSFPYTFDETHVSSASVLSPNIKVRVTYTHYDIVQTTHRKAFFETLRNQNYSNGIYNTVFVSGVEPSVAPNYTSRVWWCDVNNPLYFPETNYVEVGSNDTSVQGLTKVGDYLAAVKQSKTTDTAIYLLYPTSFEEDTTYAVKQGVQGVGAIARYSFNILGDETLFLSPNGVMAIVPSQDEEHKVQNRSYFIDGKLLKEDNLSDAYSFVFDGKYWLALGGKVYVLDGNQRNSWGNDRTNLVYECYYLENVPANCFVKYEDRLVFSTDEEVCQVKGDTDIDRFIDAYDINDTDLTDVPVQAEWSTVFDDDGALHYYKTMQKKGNLVSILPTDFKFVIADVDEETFNADKTLYYILDGDNYIQCTEESVYDASTTYYVRARSATKIYVKKDEKDPIEIERSFSYSSDIPSEMYLKKKFKKYKRLQFIIRNEAAEDFGIDEVIKSYTIGNYAKR